MAIDIWRSLLKHYLYVSLLISSSAFALDASDFSGLEGWTIAAVTNVLGDFEGCDFDRKIRFGNGWVLTCSTYSYSYSFQPDAVIFVKDFVYQGRPYTLVKVLIDDEFYDMGPVPARQAR